MSLKENKNNYSRDDNNYNRSIKDNDKANELFNQNESNKYFKPLVLNDVEKNDDELNDIKDNSNENSKRRKSTHSIISMDNEINKKLSKTESNKTTEENIFKDTNIVFSLKNKIKDLNNELNKLRNESNVQNYNILEMNYKKKNKEINALKQENNFFRFHLEERKRNLGNQKSKKNKCIDNKNKYIINSVKKYKNRKLLKPMKEPELNIDKEEETERDEIIDNLKFENDKLRKIVKENYTLKSKIEELNNKIEELQEKIEALNNNKLEYKNLYNNMKLKNELLNNNMNE